MNTYDPNIRVGINTMVSMAMGTKGIAPIVNSLNQKYNTLKTDGFGWSTEMTATFQYSQIEVTDNIAVIPDVVDKASRGTSLRTEGFEARTDEIPRFAKHIAFDEKTFRDQFYLFKQLKYAMTDSIKDSVRALMYNSMNTLWQGYDNLLTLMRNQIVSTGTLEFTTFFPTSNLRDKVYGFGIKSLDANTAEKLWWKNDIHTVVNEGKNSDPISDLIAIRRSMDLFNPDGKFEMSKRLFEDLQTHSKVLIMMGRNAFPNTNADNDVILGLARTIVINGGFKDALKRLIGCDIVIVDGKAAFNEVDVENRQPKTVYRESFESNNVAYIPYGKLGEIQSSMPMLMGDVNSSDVSYGYAGRLQFLNTINELEKTRRIDAELTAIPVPEVANKMVVKTVTK